MGAGGTDEVPLQRRRLDVNHDAGPGDVVFGVRSLAHAIVAVATIREGGGRASLDIGRRGWPATVVFPGDVPSSSRRAARSSLLAVDPRSVRLRRELARGISVRARAARCGAAAAPTGAVR